MNGEDPRRKLITALIGHYEPDALVDDDYYNSILNRYPDTDTLITKLINYYEPDAEVTSDYLGGLYSRYGVEKKSDVGSSSQDGLQGLQDGLPSVSSGGTIPDQPYAGIGGIEAVKQGEWKPTPLSADDEAKFKDFITNDPNVVAWAEEFKANYGEYPEIDEANYDYRGAWKAGQTPQPYTTPDGRTEYHWGSIGEMGKELKSPDHPTRWKSDYMQMFGTDPDEEGVSEQVGRMMIGLKNGMSRVSDRVAAQQREIESGAFIVNGKPVTRNALKKRLTEREFVKGLQNGINSIQINIDPEEDPFLMQFADRQIKASGEYDQWKSLKAGLLAMEGSMRNLPVWFNDVLEEATGIENVFFRAVAGNFGKEAAMKAATGEMKDRLRASVEKVMEAAEKARQEKFAIDDPESGAVSDLIDLYQQGRYGEMGRMSLDVVLESGPVTAVAAGAAVMSGNPAVGAAFLVPAMASRNYAETGMDDSEFRRLADKEGITSKEAAENYIRTMRLAKANVSGLAEGVPEAMMGPVLAKSFRVASSGVRQVVGRVAQEAGSDAAKKVAEETAKVTAKELATNFFGAVISGGAEEATTTLANELTDVYLGLSDKGIGEIMRATLNDGILGVTSAGILVSPATGTAGAAVGYESLKGVVDNMLIIDPSIIGEFNEFVDREVTARRMTETEGEAVKDNLAKREKAVKAVPEEKVSDTETVDLVQEKQELNEKKKNLDPVYHPPIDARITAIDEQLIQGITPQEQQQEEVAPQEQPTEDTAPQQQQQETAPAESAEGVAAEADSQPIIEESTTFNPPSAPTLVDRRDQPTPKVIERNSMPISGGTMEGEILDDNARQKRFEEIQYEYERRPINEKALESGLARYKRAISKMRSVFSIQWNGAHYNGAVAINPFIDGAKRDAVIAHELGHASHSLLGEQINGNQEAVQELSAIEEFLYPDIRKALEGMEEMNEQTAKFFNYLLSADELIAEFNVYRLSDPETAERVAPVISDLLESVENNPDLVVDRNAFPTFPGLMTKAGESLVGDTRKARKSKESEEADLISRTLDKTYKKILKNIEGGHPALASFSITELYEKRGINIESALRSRFGDNKILDEALEQAYKRGLPRPEQQQAPAESVEGVAAEAEAQVEMPNESIAKAKQSLSKRLKGDALLDAEDMIDELADNGAEINEDGTVTLYHRTTKENAEKILSEGEVFGLEDGVFFSTSEKGQAEGYGDAVVRMNVPIDKIEIDDVFGNEAHVRIPTKKANQRVSVKDYLSTTESAPAAQQSEAAQEEVTAEVTPPIETPLEEVTRDSLLDYLFNLKEDLALADIQNEAEVNRIQAEIEKVEAELETRPEEPAFEPEGRPLTEEELEKMREEAYEAQQRELEQFKEESVFKEIQEVFQPISVEEYSRYMGESTYKDNKRFLKGLVTPEGGSQPIDTRQRPSTQMEDVDYFDPQDIIDFINTVASERNIRGESRYNIPSSRTRKERGPKKPDPKKKVSTGDFLRGLSKQLEKGKIGKDIAMSGIPGFAQAWNAAITAAEKTLEATAFVADIVDFLVDHLKNSPQFKALKPAQRKAYDMKGLVLNEMGFTEQEYQDSRVEAEKEKGKQAVKEARAEEREKAKEKIAALRERLDKKFKDFKEALKDKTRTEAQTVAAARKEMKDAVRESGIRFSPVQTRKLMSLIESVNARNAEKKAQDVADYVEKLKTEAELKRAEEEIKKYEKEQREKEAKERKERKELLADIENNLKAKPHLVKSKRTGKRQKVKITNEALKRLEEIAEVYSPMLDGMSLDALRLLDAMIENVIETGKIEQRDANAISKARRANIAATGKEMTGRKAGIAVPISGKQAVLDQVKKTTGTVDGGNTVILNTPEGKIVINPTEEGRKLAESLPDDFFEDATLIRTINPNMAQMSSWDSKAPSPKTRKVAGWMRARMDFVRLVEAMALTEADAEFLHREVILANAIANERIYKDQMALKGKMSDLNKKVFGSESAARKALNKSIGLSIESTDGPLQGYENVTLNEAIYLYNQAKQSSSIDKMVAAKMKMSSVLDVIKYVQNDPKAKAYADGLVEIFESYREVVNVALDAGGYLNVQKVSNTPLIEDLRNRTGDAGTSLVTEAENALEQAKANAENNVDPTEQEKLDKEVERAEKRLQQTKEAVDSMTVKKELMLAIYGSIDNIPQFEEYSPRSVTQADATAQGPNELFSTNTYDMNNAASVVSGNLVTRVTGGTLNLSSAWDMAEAYIESMPLTTHKMQLYETFWTLFHNGSDTMNNLERIYGKNYVKALATLANDAMLNKPTGNVDMYDKIGTGAMMRWLMYASADVMFFNMKTFFTQLTSGPNYMLDAATKYGLGIEYLFGLVNPKKLAADKAEILESGKFWDRVSKSNDPFIRDMEMFRKSNGPAKAAKRLSEFLETAYRKGYKLTQYADSNITIAYFGTPLYSALKERYLSDNLASGMTEEKAAADAKERAMAEFWLNTDSTQQTSDYMFRSAEQSSPNPLVRMLFTFSTVNILYTRAMFSTVSDVFNGRTSVLNGAARVAYYAAVQNLMFYAVQSGIAWMFGTDDDEERRELIRKTKYVGIINDSVNNILRGLGAYGAILAMLKDFAASTVLQSMKKNDREAFERDMAHFEQFMNKNRNVAMTVANNIPVVSIRMRDIDDATNRLVNGDSRDPRGDFEKMWMKARTPLAIGSATGLLPGSRTAARTMEGILDVAYETPSFMQSFGRITNLLSKYDYDQLKPEDFSTKLKKSSRELEKEMSAYKESVLSDFSKEVGNRYAEASDFTKISIDAISTEYKGRFKERYKEVKGSDLSGISRSEIMKKHNINHFKDIDKEKGTGITEIVLSKEGDGSTLLKPVQVAAKLHDSKKTLTAEQKKVLSDFLKSINERNYLSSIEDNLKKLQQKP